MSLLTSMLGGANGEMQQDIDELFAWRPMHVTTGLYYGINTWLGGRNFAEALTANRLYGLPFRVGPDGFHADRIGINVTTGVAGAARLGVYAHNPATFRPGALIDDCGTVDITSTAAVAVTIDETYTADAPHHIIWLALVADATASLSTAFDNIGPFGQGLDSSGGYTGVAVAQAYGELPDPFTVSGQFNRAAIPNIRLRAA